MITGTTASEVGTTSATLEAKVNPQGLPTNDHFEYGVSDCSVEPDPCTALPEGEPISGSSPQTMKAQLEGLSPATIYHFRLIAENGTTTEGPDRIFATYAEPLAGLPEGRAYEQSSPVDKDGGDVLNKQSWIKATPEGNGITFGSDFGIPGGKGAQALPFYLGSRGEGEAGWSTQGLLPPISVGERARVLGWTPDYSEVFTEAVRLGNPRTEGLIAQSTTSQAIAVVGPYASKAKYAYVGSSADGSVVLFEAFVKLPEKPGGQPIAAAVGGAPNLYAWDRDSGEVHLAGVMNDETAPVAGAFAGPYDWVFGTTGRSLREGGAERSYYLGDTHAFTTDGSVYFTAAGSGQLYLRTNPTKEQSPLDGQGKCEDLELACTIRVSASKRTVPDPAGELPAIFQGASKDGSEAFFTSPEKLTDNANTGPEQPKAQISRTSIAGGSIEEPEFISKHAIGVTVDGSHVYWADPSLHAIGRAELNGENIDSTFIPIPEGKCASEPDVSIPAEPQYVAVDAGHIYWTNTGLHNGSGEPIDGSGTIGRAAIDGDPESIEAAFICGASNPKGIAVNATHIYWANASQHSLTSVISRAAIGGGSVEPEFFNPPASQTPYGIALNSSYVYFTLNEPSSNVSFVSRVPLEGGKEEFLFTGESGVRGVALDSGHVYWVSQSEGAIGRADLELTLAGREKHFIDTEGTVNGLADDGTHLLLAVNGEAPTNPGNDLYRFQRGGGLEDITPDADPTDTNGAEVQGVLGVSADGSHVYFAANGDLDGPSGPAQKGTCKGPVKFSSGKCNLYLWDEGSVRFVAPLDANDGSNADSLNWVGSPVGALDSSSYTPRTAFLGKDGEELLFRSQEKLSPYDNEAVPEFYLYRAGDESISCTSCRPSGEAVGEGPRLGTANGFPVANPPDEIAAFASRNLSASGGRFFFETAEALSPSDTNGQGGCPPIGTDGTPSCLDVYEWEAPEEGTCKTTSPSYNPLNNGCLYLISTGKSTFPSFFADASADGKNAFFFTRQQLVGQDKDELQDVYDARVEGGLASQNPITPVPCESTEGCHGPGQSPPVESTPATPGFHGPSNPKPKHQKQAHKHKHKKKHAKHKKHKKGRRANTKGRAQR